MLYKKGKTIRIGIDENFITILSDDSTKPVATYGGDQNWLPDRISHDACGITAAVNLVFYFIGATAVRRSEYIAACEKYCSKHAWNVWLIRLGIGALPRSLGRFIQQSCRLRHIPIQYVGWKWKDGIWLYDKMKQMLSENIPVLWGLYSIHASKKKTDGLTLYRISKDGNLIADQQVYSHYVIVTGIIETTQTDGTVNRLIEISSWGNKYVVRYDEFLAFIEGKNKLQAWINKIGSGILVIRKEKTIKNDKRVI